MQRKNMTLEEKAAAFDKLAELCVAEMFGAEELSTTPDGKRLLEGRGSYLKDVKQYVWEKAMVLVFGDDVFTHYNKLF